ncbi:MAG: alpha/beta fold hydrolase [Maricaulaceae bacterium]
MTKRPNAADPPVTVDVVALHGWAMGPGSFRAVAAHLPHTISLHCPALRGHAEGPALEEHDGLDALAADIAPCLSANGDRPVLLWGWSMGAVLAWKALADNPNLPICGLVVEDMAPCVPKATDWPWGLIDPPRGGGPDRGLYAMAENWPRWARAAADHVFRDACDPESVPIADQAFDVMVRQDGAIMARLYAELLEQDLRAVASDLTPPCLIIHGGLSALYPAAAAIWMERSATRAQRVCFATAGHAPHWEAPRRFAAVLTEFALKCAKTPGRATPSKTITNQYLGGDL